MSLSAFNMIDIEMNANTRINTGGWRKTKLECVNHMKRRMK